MSQPMIEQLGKYKILAKIGHGAMGEVYKAHDTVLNRLVAIKTISPELSSDETLRQRFQREARAAARLNHPNIVTVFEADQAGEVLFMAMELLEGTDLKQAILKKSLTTQDEKISVMEQMADGLAFAHSHDIVHRDLKPANMHLQAGNQVKIMDFGLARFSGSEMTRTGMVMGTPQYMAPEQVRGERADARSDVFALGSVFYEVLTGVKAFDADSMHSVLFKVMQEDPRPLRELAPDTPVVLAQVIEKALAKDPAQRFKDAGELRAGLSLARNTMAAGKGNQPIVELAFDPTPVPRKTKAASGTMRPDGSPSRSGSGSRSGSRSGTSSGGGGSALYVGGGVAAALVGGAILFAVTREPAAPPSAPPATRTAQVDTLAQAVVGTEVELARKKLEAHDWREAMRRADRALKLDPSNADAKEIFAKAKKVVDEMDAAAAEAKAAAATGDAKKAGDGLWKLIQVDPASATLADIGPAQESTFKDHAGDARKLAADARAAAEKARATALESFSDGVGRQQAGEAAFKGGQYVTAAKAFLEARDRFERALRRVS